MSVVNGVVRAGDQAHKRAANYGIPITVRLLTSPDETSSHRHRSAHWFRWTGEGVKDPLGCCDGATPPRSLTHGTRVAFEARNPHSDVLIGNIRRGLLTQVTSDGPLDMLPVWSRDSQRLVWASLAGEVSPI